MNDSMSNVATASVATTIATRLDDLIEPEHSINDVFKIGSITDVEIHNPFDSLNEILGNKMGVYPPRRVVTYGQ